MLHKVEQMINELQKIEDKFSSLLSKLLTGEVEGSAEEMTANERDEFSRLYMEYFNKRREIRLEFIYPWNSLIDINGNIRDKLKSIINNKLLPFEENILKVISMGSMSRDQFDEYLGNRLPEADQFDSELEQYFYQWFGAPDFILNMHEIGAIILDFKKVPTFLSSYICEIRKSYSFGNYLAVIALCRSLIEICVHRAYQLKWERENRTKSREAVFRSEIKSFWNHTKEVCQNNRGLKNKIDEVYENLNNIVHGNLFGSGAPDKGCTLGVFKATLGIVEKLL